jgi:hypothetical protein
MTTSVMKNNRGFVEIIIVGIITLLLVAGGYWYYQTQNQKPETKPIPTVAPTSVPTENLLPTSTPNTTTRLEIPVDYGPDDVKAFVTIIVDAPSDGELNISESNSPKLLLPDSSILSFGVSHISPTLSLDVNEITKVNTKNYENTYRFKYEDDMTYANLKVEGNCGTQNQVVDNDRCKPELYYDGVCHESEIITYNAPCGSPTFHYMIIRCDDPKGSYALCDKVMESISGIEPNYD